VISHRRGFSLSERHYLSASVAERQFSPVMQAFARGAIAVSDPSVGSGPVAIGMNLRRFAGGTDRVMGGQNRLDAHAIGLRDRAESSHCSTEARSRRPRRRHSREFLQPPHTGRIWRCGVLNRVAVT